ncbi:dihydrofolate reductase family protein [Microbacterium invictum]|uniref:Dihydrofolate reductase n=1 Tax=Microbacterium invictum TaxID=515415 RepID=A0AA40SRJ4_9MICO|nr:dihydrofolate reductase family protein [Microbacterium invictum]MBB4140925.1 dihydrofolate reductase [Microbacterium invictum]
MTGRIIIDLFTTVDGVAQAPGGADEDREGGFEFGGWQAPFADRTSSDLISGGIARMDALLLGRRTYDNFAGYWPHQRGTIAEVLNRVPKYVATRGTLSPEWTGTTQLGLDLAAEIAALRERHGETHVIGSVDLVQSLLADDLYDELKLWIYPVVLGQGKKVFPDGAAPTTLRLVAPAVTTENGLILLRYAPAGPVVAGKMAPEG